MLESRNASRKAKSARVEVHDNRGGSVNRRVSRLEARCGGSSTDDFELLA